MKLYLQRTHAPKGSQTSGKRSYPVSYLLQRLGVGGAEGLSVCHMHTTLGHTDMGREAM